MAMSGPLPNRRQLLGGMLAAAALEVPTLAVPATGNMSGAGEPAEHLRAYMLMRGAVDESLVMSSISCEYFGVVDGVMTPFYDLVAVTFARFRQANDLGYDAVSFEIEYFIDRQTGEVLDKWRNPYSGQTLTAKHNDSMPVRFKIGRDMRLASTPTDLAPGVEVVRESPRLQFAGNDVWVEEKTVATVPVAGARPMHFNESVRYHAKASDIARLDATRVQVDVSYLGVSSFRPWQAMGDRSGHMVGYGVGGSGLALKDLPPRWLRLTERLHPEALTHPEAYLEPLWKAL